MKSLVNWTTLIALGSAAVAFVGCGDGGKEGEEGGACFSNGTCNDGLECRSDLCVAGPDDGTRSVDEVLEDCTTCGEASCAAEAAACEEASGCADVFTCWIGCGADQNCIEACDLTKITAADLGKVSEYQACTVLECLSECTPDSTVSGSGGGAGTDGGTGGTSSGTGGGSPTEPGADPCDEEGEFKGSCTTDDLQQCINDLWTESSCEGCELVSPTGTCSYVRPVTLRSIGDSYVSEQPTDLDFVQTSELVQAEWYLDAGEVGVLEFFFESSPSEDKVKVLGASGDVGRITLEAQDGSSGCQYTLDADGSLERDADYGYDDDFNLVLHWNGCWGLWESNVSLGSGPTSAGKLAIQSDEATSNQLVSLSVTRVLL